MMFTGRLSVQAWTSGSQDAQMQGLGIDGGDGVSIAPPLYRDVARRALSTRTLSTDATSPNDTTTPGGGLPQLESRIQEEDISRLAARIVALMPPRRHSSQAWTPESQDAQRQGLGFDVGDDVSTAPPMYRDVARRVLSAEESGSILGNNRTLLTEESDSMLGNSVVSSS